MLLLILDKAIGVIYEACKANNYILFVTADHGNAEQMISPTGGPHTAHTCNRGDFPSKQTKQNKQNNHNSEFLILFLVHIVPFVMATKKLKFGRKDGALCDVAPTVLQAMGLSIPAEMTGHSILA